MIGDRLPETCERCNGWVYHRRTPCECRPPAVIRHVPQEQTWGCGPAALSMLTGVPYAEVCAAFDVDFAERGLDYMRADSWLADRGYATGRKWRYGCDRKERADWPPSPWASAHLCEVVVSESSPGGHFVVMLRDGSVLDPLTPTPRQLADYHKVNNVAAVTKLIKEPTP